MNDDAEGYIQSEGALFQLAQLLRVFSDSKAMVDATPRQDSGEIAARLDAHVRACADDLRALPGDAAGSDAAYVQAVARRLNRLAGELDALIAWGFEQPGATAQDPPPSDSMEQHIERMWWVLARRPGDRRESSNLLALPRPYVVAGGRYLEFFYWDSYYTSLGLLASGRVAMLENVVENMADLIARYGFVPNGTRTYFRTRSQAPHFALLLRLLAAAKGEAAARAYRDVLAREHAFWSSAARTHPPPGGAGPRLNHYWDDRAAQIPPDASADDLLHALARPEGYREDIKTCYEAEAAGRPRSEWKQILIDLRAACESGWDFSSRWLRKAPYGAWPLWTIRTSSILPVDLNCLCYSIESLLAKWEEPAQGDDFAQRAEQRRAALQHAPFWQEKSGWFYDVAVGPDDARTPIDVDSLAGVYALFCKVATDKQAEAVARRIEQKFLKPGGVVTSLESFQTGQQWDYPNGWAPLQWATIAGLVNYGHDDLAREIARRFVGHARRTYDRTGKMMEKYDVVDLDRPGGGGEYPNQDGFGWTNGVVRACIEFLGGNIFWQ